MSIKNKVDEVQGKPISARDKLVLDHLDLVKYIVNRMPINLPPGIDIERQHDHDPNHHINSGPDRGHPTENWRGYPGSGPGSQRSGALHHTESFLPVRDPLIGPGFFLEVESQ